MPAPKVYCLLCLCLLALSCRTVRNSPQEVQSNDKDSVQTVLIHESGGFLGPCEPSICINPVDNRNIVAGAVLDFVYHSTDGGRSWKRSKLNSTYGVYGDPVIRADFQGNFYYSHLSNPGNSMTRGEDWLDRIVVQKSTDGGQSWNDGTFPEPRPPKDQDKQWMAIDPADNSIFMSWTEFDQYGSKEEEHKSRILFSKSTDLGESWSTPLQISQYEGNCEDDDQTTEGAVPSVGLDGEVFIAWAYDEKIYFDRSLDGGTNWLQEDIVVADQPGGWSFEIPGIMRTNGMPVTAVDRSESPYSGNIYVNWADQRNGVDDTDIWICASSDGGNSWSDPVRVNDDPAGKQQFFSWMAVDDYTGYIYIVFYDRRNYIDNETDVYLAWSRDGGRSFKNKKISSESFRPNPLVFFGDYNDISVINGMIRPIWTQLNSSHLSIWTAIIDQQMLD